MRARIPRAGQVAVALLVLATMRTDAGPAAPFCAHAHADGAQPADVSLNRVGSFAGSGKVTAWREDRTIKMAGRPAWPVPADPTWAENPFKDVTWLRTYHSLKWLQAPMAAYQETGDADYAREIAHYVVSWIRLNPADDPPSHRSWFDGAVALRTDAMVSYLPVLRQELDAAGLDMVLESLTEHGNRLLGYLSNPRWFGHNHNLFHALSLHNLGQQVPELPASEQWREAAYRRIVALQMEMVDPDGVSLEQAAGYHFTALKWFSLAVRYFEGLGTSMPAANAELLRKMTRFAALLATPIGSLPAIGDTYHGVPTPFELLDPLRPLGLVDPQAIFIMSRGRCGQRPSDFNVFEDSGYVIMRPTYGEEASWEDDLHLVFDVGEYRWNHGHNDAMNVLVTARSQPMLVDSGGPYQYDRNRRPHYLHAAAHNTVTVDGRDYRRDGNPFISYAVDGDTFSAAEAWHRPADGVRHRRTVIVLKPEVVVIVDWLENPLDTTHRYELLHHLNPSAEVALTDSGATAVVGDASMTLTVSTDAESRIRIRHGEPSSPIGWVTTGTRRETEAPVLSIQEWAETASFVTVLTFGDAPNPASPTVHVDHGDHQVGIDVGLGESRWHLTLVPGAPPQVGVVGP